MIRTMWLFPLLLSACVLAPHKIDMQQGNWVDQTALAKLKPGMTRAQVRFVLGTPLVADLFHPDRWDYVYLTGKAGEVRARSRIAVLFEGDKLSRVEGGGEAAEKLSQTPLTVAKP